MSGKWGHSSIPSKRGQAKEVGLRVLTAMKTTDQTVEPRAAGRFQRLQSPKGPAKSEVIFARATGAGSTLISPVPVC